MPRKVGKYILGTLLASSAASQVYVCTVEGRTDKLVAKLVPVDDTISDSMRSGVLREVSILRQIMHPHVVTLHDVIRTHHHIYLIFQYAGNGPLSGHIPLSEEVARSYLRQLICGLAYLHRHSILHRDIKPPNVLVSSDKRRVLLSDLGFARVIAHCATTRLGTPAYVAPEVINCDPRTGGAPGGYSYAADVWSLGVTLFEAMTGELPFPSKDVQMLYTQITRGVFEWPATLSPSATSLLRGMLTVSPVRRSTLADVASHPWVLDGISPSEAAALADSFAGAIRKTVCLPRPYDVVGDLKIDLAPLSRVTRSASASLCDSLPPLLFEPRPAVETKALLLAECFDLNSIPRCVWPSIVMYFGHVVRPLSKGVRPLAGSWAAMQQAIRDNDAVVLATEIVRMCSSKALGPEAIATATSASAPLMAGGSDLPEVGLDGHTVNGPSGQLPGRHPEKAVDQQGGSAAGPGSGERQSSAAVSADGRESAKQSVTASGSGASVLWLQRSPGHSFVDVATNVVSDGATVVAAYRSFAGGHLGTLIPLPVDVLRPYFRQILAGVGYLHLAGTPARHISPHTVLVPADRRSVRVSCVSRLVRGDVANEGRVYDVYGLFTAPEVMGVALDSANCLDLNMTDDAEDAPVKLDAANSLSTLSCFSRVDATVDPYAADVWSLGVSLAALLGAKVVSPWLLAVRYATGSGGVGQSDPSLDSADPSKRNGAFASSLGSVPFDLLSPVESPALLSDGSKSRGLSSSVSDPATSRPSAPGGAASSGATMSSPNRESERSSGTARTGGFASLLTANRGTPMSELPEATQAAVRGALQGPGAATALHAISDACRTQALRSVQEAVLQTSGDSSAAGTAAKSVDNSPLLDLLSSMMDPDPSARPRLSAVLQHPWVLKGATNDALSRLQKLATELNALSVVHGIPCVDARDASDVDSPANMSASPQSGVAVKSPSDASAPPTRGGDASQHMGKARAADSTDASVVTGTASALGTGPAGGQFSTVSLKDAMSIGSSKGEHPMSAASALTSFDSDPPGPGTSGHSFAASSDHIGSPKGGSRSAVHLQTAPRFNPPVQQTGSLLDRPVGADPRAAAHAGHSHARGNVRGAVTLGALGGERPASGGSNEARAQTVGGDTWTNSLDGACRTPSGVDGRGVANRARGGVARSADGGASTPGGGAVGVVASTPITFVSGRFRLGNAQPSSPQTSTPTGSATGSGIVGGGQRVPRPQPSLASTPQGSLRGGSSSTSRGSVGDVSSR